MNDSFSSIEVRVNIWSYSSKVFWFLIFHVFSFMCSHFCESSAYLVVINIFYYKFIEVFMRGDFRKHLSFCTFLDSLPHSFFANTKKRDVTSHPIMTCNGAIIWDTSFEQRSFALKLFILRLIASSPLIVDTAYAHITTSVFFWISQYWSCLIIFPDPEIQEHHDCIGFWGQQNFLTEHFNKLDEMSRQLVISFMIKESFIYLFASQCEMWFQESLRTDFVQRVMAKTVESFYARKMFFLCRENIFRLTTDIGSRVLLTLSMF